MDYIYTDIIRFIATCHTFIPIANLYDFGIVNSMIISRKILDSDKFILPKIFIRI